MQRKAMVYVGKAFDQAEKIILQHDGAMIANYGQSVLVRMGDEGLQALGKAGHRVRELPEQPMAQIAGFKLNAAVPSGLSTSVEAAKRALPSGRSHHIVHLAGPMHPDWKDKLERMGVIFHQNMGDDRYLVSVDSTKVDGMQAFEFVETVSPYFPAMKISPILLTTELKDTLPMVDALVPAELEAAEKAVETDAQPGTIGLADVSAVPLADSERVGNLEIVLFEGEDLVAVADAVRELGAKVNKSSRLRIIVYADMQVVSRIAAIPQVREINPYRPAGLTNNVATGIIHTDTLQNDHGLDGSGQIVGIADSGIDTGVDDATMLADFQGRIVSIHALGRPGDASDIHNHGTHVAGSVLGDGANSNGRIRGMAPAAQVVFQSTMDADRGLGGLPDDLGDGLLDVALADGAHIHTNSWGANVEGAYTDRSRDVDIFAFNNRDFLILFAAGNWGQDMFGNLLTGINSPGTAKNALTVGASESVRPLPNSVQFPNSPTYPADAYPGGPVWPDFDERADNQDHVAGFSCLGPAQYNRQKPDIVAPGSFILSTRSTVSVDDTGPDGLADTGDENDVWTHAEAVGLGLPGQSFYGSGDQNAPDAPAGSGPDVADNYYYSDGTSMSTPITAGACVLLRQYLIEQRGHTPSAALLKALIINGAVDMGMGIPHNGQGWGRVDLTSTLFPAGTHRVQFDDTLENAVATGEIRTYDVWVSATTEPLVVTLVWRDYRGSTIENDLHLRVIHVDSGTESSSEDIADIRNNVQKVVIDPPQVGRYRIEVEGVNVTHGVPELANLRQDYALVVANAIGFSCNPSDIVQVIDRSGSMGTSGYIEPAKERAKQMIDIQQINDQAGLVTFAASAVEEMGLTTINSQDDKDDAHNQINPITSGGMTDLREALEQGLATLGPDTGRSRTIVFLSDGKHTVATPEIDNAFLDDVAALNASVYTIALGPASDFAVLNNIASRTGTDSVYTVESAADLHKLHEIYYNIMGGIGCGGVTHLTSTNMGTNGELTQDAAISRTAREAFFAASWPQLDAKIEFALKAPSGKIYTAGSPESIYFQGSTHAFYRIAKPETGTWELIVKHRNGGDNHPLLITTAAMAESEAACEVHLDPKYLYEDKVLLSLKAHHHGRPLVGGKAFASITYPTQSIQDLLQHYADELKEIDLNEDRLAGDVDDHSLIRLGILAARYGSKGKDIFERETVEILLRDDGKEKDPKADDGIYTAFFDPKQAGVAGNYQIQTNFTVEDEKLGTHTCTKLIPVHVPKVDEVEAELKIKDIFVRRNRLWGYIIIGARVLKADDSPATPGDGVTVNMTLIRGFRKVKSNDLPYYSRGHYYIWRYRDREIKPSEATLQVMAKLDGMIVATAKLPIRL